MFDDPLVRQVKIASSGITVFNQHERLPRDASLPMPDHEDVIENICIADRTMYIPYILRDRAVLFLRPRRFGKSLWVNTLKMFFMFPRQFMESVYAIARMEFEIARRRWAPLKGVNEFEGLHVLCFDFSAKKANAKDLELALKFECIDMAKSHRVKVYKGDTWDSLLERMIRQLSHGLTMKTVVVLVDEYDACLNSSSAPLNSNEFQELKEVHSRFYSLLKMLSGGILLRYVTGISRWVLRGMFSGPNDIHDLTLDPVLSQLLGFTKAEISLICDSHPDRPDMPRIFRERCNVYCFDTEFLERKVYNPFYVACEIRKFQSRFADRDRLENVDTSDHHWAASGPRMPTKYRKLFEQLDEMRLPLRVPLSVLKEANSEDDKHPEVILFYMGYLTIKQVATIKQLRTSKELSTSTELMTGDDGNYTLNFPNDALRNYLIEEFLARVKE